MANFNIDYLVVAGGGGGARSAFTTGGASGGGGGAGEFLYKTSQTLTTEGSGYTVTVGDGGNAGVSGVSATNGGNSVFIDTTLGGGYGGTGNSGTYSPGASGGSGGGSGINGSTVYAGGSSTATSPGLGNAGGASTSASSAYGAGGGGGAGTAGSNGTSSTGGNGGTGVQNSITSTATFYAGGGGGGSFNNNNVGSGGSGVGGNANARAAGSPGASNTGSGGGGGSYSGSAHTNGAPGGSGIVILRFPTADVASYTATGLTPTETTDGTDTILSFTTVGTGTITFTAPAVPTPTPFDGTRATTPVTGFNKTGTSEGLKLPSGDNSNQPTGAAAEQGMIRNDTQETVDSSASAIVHYNGTNWQYFAATESPDPVPTNPLILSSVMYYSASDTTSYPGSGTDWFDLSGNSNTATITSSNYSNGYFDLTPTASIITTPVNTLYQTFSYSIWVKFDSVTVASGYALNVLSKSQFYASNVQAFPLYAAVTTTGTFTNNLSYGNDYSPDVTNSTSVSVNTWYNIACVIDTTTNTSKLYIGTESTQLALVNSVNYTGTLVNSPNQFYSLGKAPAEYGGGVGKSSMNGKIAKFGFWDTALTEAELITIWGLGSGVT